MSLQDTLDTMKEEFESGLPPEIRATMHKATDDLAKSGIMEQVLKPGTPIPVFSLPDERDNEVSPQDLLARGPLVITFYRGIW